MSVSDMNVSWSTRSSIQTDKNTQRSTFITSSKHGAEFSRLQRPKCVSAKHSGMRFQGWREPKPLRSRCSSAVLTEEVDKCNTERLKSARRSAREKTDVEKEMVDRLSQPTKSSIWKTSSARAREVGTDMNYYSWSRMNVYKDYQKVLYGDNGTVKQINRGKARLRALITRVQTMRTSTMVAIGILAGLLLIFYLKEIEYKKRVAMTGKHVSKSKLPTPRGVDKMADISAQINHLEEEVTFEDRSTVRKESEQSSVDTTTSTMYQSTGETTNGFTDGELENIIRQRLRDKLDEENNAQKTEQTTQSYSDKEGNDIYKVVNGNTDNTPQHTKTVGAEAQSIQKETENKSHSLTDEEKDIADETKDSRSDLNKSKIIMSLKDLVKPQYIQMELNSESGHVLDEKIDTNEHITSEDQSEINGIVPIETRNDTAPLETMNNAESLTSGSPDVVKQQIQTLLRKYSSTASEVDLPRQNETYTHRLRNKLIQTGRFDLLANENCKKRFPQCIIIGVMKAGTEAFSTFLGVHPQVAMQFGYAAMVFFSSPQFENGYEWYRERMMCSTRDQITMEKSPQYFSSPLAPKRIFEMDPNMKLIVLVREPIARALSHFLQQQSSRPERLSAPTFEECVYDNITNTVKEDSPYIQQSKYSVLLRRWLEYFPYKQILIIDGDTFKKNPTRSLSKTESFLEIDHSISRDRLYFNEEKGFYCLKINSTLQEDLDRSCFGSEKGRPHPAIDPVVESALKTYFKPFNDDFMDITKMRMNW